MLKRIMAFSAILAVSLAAGTAHAADHEIKMLNAGESGIFVFEPDFIRVAPGDRVTFIPTDKGHNAESIKGMLPEGAKPFKGAIGKEITVTITSEGIYGVKCGPHYGMGMVAVILAGEPVNLVEARAVKHPPEADWVIAPILADIAPAELLGKAAPGEPIEASGMTHSAHQSASHGS